MGIIDFVSDLKGPVFYKDESDAERDLEYLRTLDPTPEIQLQIKLVEAGIQGEKQIRFELENGHIPCYVLHDLYLEHDGLSVQIDYLIICRKCIYVIECKNLVGNIEIDSQGNFTRVFNYGKYYRKEGLYSPITQNERHIGLIKQILRDKNVINKLVITKGEDDVWKSIVVLSNPKTYLNNKYAKKEIKEKVIKADQLVSYIKKTEAESKNITNTDRQMEDIAAAWLARCKTNPADYKIKYDNILKSAAESSSTEPEVAPIASDTEKKVCPRCGREMVLRTAKKGARTGEQFYGCSGFPKCRYSESLKR